MKSIEERIKYHDEKIGDLQQSIARANNILDNAQNKINFHRNAIENLKKRANKQKVTEIPEQGVVITETPKYELDPEDSKPEHKDVN